MRSPMDALNLALLGGFRLHTADGVAIALGGRKPQALLAYMALQPGERFSRDRLAALLWEDRADSQARQSLRQALVGLRRALPRDEQVLATETDTVGLLPNAVAVDIDEFERLLDDGTRSALTRAVELYRGEFLEGFNPRAPAFEDWLMAQRSRLCERALVAMEQLLDHELAQGAIERAVRLALRLLALDPLRESVQRTLMELYARQGHYGAAIRQFRVCQRTLRRELDIAPEKATEQLYRQLVAHRQSPSAEPAEEAQESTPPRVAEAPRPPAAPELRQAVVLMVRFATAEGDPEARHARLQHCHEKVVEQLRHYGGRAVHRLSDGLLAVFGVPAAHSNDAERAIRAAATIRDALPGSRLGIASGRVVATGEAPPTLTGSAVDQASALASRAEIGEILLSAPLRTSVVGRIDADPIFAAGNAVWRLRTLRARTPLEQPAFVGRQSERRQFRAALDACRETDCGQSLLVRGEAGIGKTRLLQEYAAQAEDHHFACYKVLVLDFGAEQDPIRALVRRLLGQDPGAAEDQVHAAAERALTDGLVDTDQRAELYDLLGLPLPPALKAAFGAMDSATRRQRRRRLVVELITARARRQPLLVAVEDIHWADAVTLDYLAGIATCVADCPTLLVMSHRVEGEPLDPAWRGAMHGAPLTTIDLGPLRGDEAKALAVELAAEDDDFVAWCIERAGGNPLFLEQLLRGRTEGGAVPDSVRSIVWARLDCLDVADKRAAQAAAILSQRFAPAALHHLLDVADYDCSPLVEQRLLRPQGEEYQFSHALIREGVYDSLLGSQRRELHRRAADWFRHRDALLTAQHLDRAESSEAANAYLDAARVQISAYRYERAGALIARGLDLAREARERYALTFLHGDVLHATGAMDAAIAAYRRAVDLAADNEQRCRAWLGVAAGYGVKDRHDDALAALDQAERLGVRRAQPLAELYSLRGNVLFPLGRLAECLKAHQRARQYAREASAPELEARALSGLADAEYMQGRMITAHGHFDRCVELCRRHDLARIEASNLSMRGLTRFYQNDLQAAHRDARQAIELAVRIGHLRAETLARDMLFYVLHYRGDWLAAREQAEQGLALAQRLGAQRFEADCRLNLAHVLLAQGQRGAAERHLDEAYAFSREATLVFVGPWILAALATATDNADKRRWALAEGEALLAAGSISHNYLQFYQLAIDVALEDADWQSAARYCAALEDYTREEPLPWSAFFIARGRALAAWRSGPRDEPTRQALQHLADESKRIGMGVALPALHAALAED